MDGKQRIEKYVEAYRAEYGKDNQPVYEIMLMDHPCKELMSVRDGKEVPSGWPDIGDNRMGFYYELDRAIQAMNENWADIQEHCFLAGFITCHFPGLYNEVGPWGRIYFLWDEDREGFFEAEEPA